MSWRNIKDLYSSNSYQDCKNYLGWYILREALQTMISKGEKACKVSLQIPLLQIYNRCHADKKVKIHSWQQRRMASRFLWANGFPFQFVKCLAFFWQVGNKTEIIIAISTISNLHCFIYKINKGSFNNDNFFKNGS